MEIKKNIRLAYRIEQKPDGGFVARSDDAGVEPIEAATKVELFKKMREKTAALIGTEIPLDFEHQQSAEVVNIQTRRIEPPEYLTNSDAKPQAQGWSVNVWKVAFFVLLAGVVVWVFLHR